MRRIIQANIDRLKEFLKTEIDPVKRAMENKLLAEDRGETRAGAQERQESLLAVFNPETPMGRRDVDQFSR